MPDSASLPYPGAQEQVMTHMLAFSFVLMLVIKRLLLAYKSHVARETMTRQGVLKELLKATKDVWPLKGRLTS